MGYVMRSPDDIQELRNRARRLAVQSSGGNDYAEGVIATLDWLNGDDAPDLNDDWDAVE